MAIIWNKDGSVEFEGAVLAHPVYHASACNKDWEDVYATVWTGREVRDISVGIVAYANGQVNASVTVDATDETKALVHKWYEALAAENRRQSRIAAQLKALVTIAKGDTVFVFKGRKNKGERVAVSWIGDGQWGRSIRTTGGVFISADNIRKVISRSEYEALRASYFNPSSDEKRQEIDESYLKTCIEEWADYEFEA